MDVCTYEEFLLVKKKFCRNIPRGIISEAFKDIRCRTAFTVYVLLYDLAEISGVVDHTISISHSTIAKLINASPRTSKRALEFLQANGYIEIIHCGSEQSGYLSNKIKLRFPKYLLQKILDEES